MALIGSIRKQGKLVVIVIGVALALFVITSFDRKGIISCKGDKQRNIIGEVAGERITYREFEAKVDEQKDMQKQQSGKENVTAAEEFQIREQIWKNDLRDIILGKEYEALGMDVSAEELSDLVTGKEPSQMIIQNFTDPQTGQFNPMQVRSFMQNLDQYEQQKPGTKAQWENLLESIKSDRIYNKYLNLIKGGIYIPKAIAKKDFEQKNKKAVFRFFADKYSNIPDNTITLTQDDFQKYYDEHKHEYQQEASRDIEYVVFDVNPSDADMKKVTDDVKQIRSEMEKVDNKDMPTFVNKNSDDKYDSLFYKKGALPMAVDSVVFKPKTKVGEIFGPYYNETEFTFTIAKVIDFQMRPDSMKASHILISYKGAMRADEKITRTQDQAKKMADSLLTVLKKNPKKFEDIAKTNSDDPTAKAKSGDLGRFADGTMIGPFNDACIKNKEGDLLVVETPFGYHVLKVTGKKSPEKKAQVAIIERKAEPSNETFQAVYSQASAFAGENTTVEQFNKTVIDKKLNKRLAENITPMSNNIAGLESPREIVRWIYDEKTKKNDISKVFDMQGKYIIAYIKEIREKGTPSLDQVKTEIEPLVKREKKADQIIKKINGMKSAGVTIDQLAAKDGKKLDTLDFISFSSYSLPGYGPEPKVIGTLFTLKKGELSEPIQGNSAIFVVYIDNFSEPPANADYAASRNQMMMNYKSRVSYDVYNTLEKGTKIVDDRLLFY